MKKCPKCAQTYEDRQQVCPIDKTALIIVDPMIGRLLDNRYQIISKIGEGGMGAIYKAVHSEMGRTCAIKLMTAISTGNEDAVARFKREAKMASRIDNPHAVIIYDFGVAEGGMLFLAMEFIDGKPLSRAMAEQRMLPIDRVVHITNQIAEGLAAAHALEIVHRDLKPDNIMVTRKGNDSDYVKVLDFGIAKTVADDGEGAENLTKTGFVLGTPVYMSPEQLLGEKLDPRSDIYSLAIIVYQMLGGQLPFTGDNPQSVMMKRITSNPVPLRSIAPTVSEAIEQVVMDGLARDAENRTPTVETFAKALSLAARGSTKPVGDRPTQRMPEVESHTMEWSRLQTDAQKSAPTKEDGTLTFQSPSTVERSRDTYPLTQAGQPFTQPQTAERPPQRRTAENTALPFDPAPAQSPTIKEQSMAPSIAPTPEKFITNKDLNAPVPSRTEVVSQPVRRSKPIVLWAGIGAAVIAIAVIAFLLIPRGGSGFAINIKGAPPGSMVYVNDAQRSSVGSDGTIKLADLQPGQAAVRITRDGYTEFTTTVSGNKGEEKSVDAMLLPMEVDYKSKMVLIPGGDFEMGSDARKVTLPAYYLDKYEVTNADYKKFCDATGHPYPKSTFMFGVFKQKTPAEADEEYFTQHPNSPVIGVTYEDAAAYAAWAGKRLPREDEWEKAASWDPNTGKKRLYAWGNGTTGVRVNVNRKQDAVIAPGGEFTDDKSAFGVFDMGGNVPEWIAPGNQNGSRNLGDEKRFAKGGAFFMKDYEGATSTSRSSYDAKFAEDNKVQLPIGFRCAVSVDDSKIQEFLRSRSK